MAVCTALQWRVNVKHHLYPSYLFTLFLTCLNNIKLVVMNENEDLDTMERWHGIWWKEFDEIHSISQLWHKCCIFWASNNILHLFDVFFCFLIKFLLFLMNFWTMNFMFVMCVWKSVKKIKVLWRYYVCVF